MTLGSRNYTSALSYHPHFLPTSLLLPIAMNFFIIIIIPSPVKCDYGRTKEPSFILKESLDALLATGCGWYLT